MKNNDRIMGICLILLGIINIIMIFIGMNLDIEIINWIVVSMVGMYLISRGKE